MRRGWLVRFPVLQKIDELSISDSPNNQLVDEIRKKLNPGDEPTCKDNLGVSYQNLDRGIAQRFWLNEMGVSGLCGKDQMF